MSLRARRAYGNRRQVGLTSVIERDLEQAAMKETTSSKQCPTRCHQYDAHTTAQSPSQLWACTLVGVDRSVFRRRSVNDDRAKLVSARIAALSLRYPVAGRRAAHGNSASSRSTHPLHSAAPEARLQHPHSASPEQSAAFGAPRRDLAPSTNQVWAHGFVIDCGNDRKKRQCPEGTEE